MRSGIEGVVPTTRIITAPDDRDGVSRALRNSFHRALELPEDWRRLLNRLP